MSSFNDPYSYHGLLGAAHKIQRAKVHLDSLQAAFVEYVESNPCPVVAQFDQETNNWIIWATITRGSEIKWATILSDFMHNTRNALDYIVYELGLLNGGKTFGRSQFPITESPADFDNKGRGGGMWMLQALRPEDAALIREEQPFARFPQNPQADPLWLLRKVNDADKHRLLQFARATTETIEFSFKPEPTTPYAITFKPQPGTIPSEIGTPVIVARADIAGLDPYDEKVEVYTRTTIKIVADKGGFFPEGAGLVTTLAEVGKRVYEIANRFAGPDHFGPIGPDFP